MLDDYHDVDGERVSVVSDIVNNQTFGYKWVMHMH